MDRIVRRWSAALGGLFLCVVSSGALVAGEKPPEAAADRVAASVQAAYQGLRGEQLAYGGNCEGAVARLEAALDANPHRGDLWGLLGACQVRLGAFDAAVATYSRSRELGGLRPGQASLGIARAQAGAGRTDEAVEAVRATLRDGYRDRSRLGRDKYLKSLAQEPGFRALVTPPDLPGERVAAWSADLEVVLQELRRVHWLYRQQDLPQAFLEALAQIEGDIAKMTDAQVLVRIQGALASLGDGHTLIYPFGMERGSLHRLPFSFYLFADGLFVVSADPGWEQWRGAEVVAVGGRPVKEALERIGSLASADNRSGLRWVAPLYLQIVEFLEVADLAAEQEVQLTLENGQDETVVVSVPALTTPLDPSKLPMLLPAAPGAQEDQALWLSRAASTAWLADLDRETLYVQINRMVDGGDESFAAFCRRVGAALAEKGRRTVIVDLRHNLGGEGSLSRELVRELIHFEHSRPQAQVLVLIGRSTFSAGQTLVNRIEEMTGAVFLGEPTGSRPNRFGNEAPFRLPYSGALGSISAGYNQGASSDDRRVWVAPRVLVQLTSADYFGHQDPVLEAARRWAADAGSRGLGSAGTW